MILKLKDSVHPGKWFYWDSITRLSVDVREFQLHPDGKIYRGKEPYNLDADFFDLDVVLSDPVPLKVCTLLINEEEKLIAFIGLAYILSDDGKTIDKL